MALLSIGTVRESDCSQSPELFPEETRLFRPRKGIAEMGRQRLVAEMRYLGTTLAVHPLSLWPNLLVQPRTLARDLPDHVGRSVHLIGWPITAKPVFTASSQPMEFISFEDETALYETVLFPESYKRFRHLIFQERPVLVYGKVEKDRGADTLTIINIERYRVLEKLRFRA
jgi:DNA polymerase III alpha subunit